MAQIEWAARATDLQGTRIESFDKLLGAPDSYLEESQSEFAWTAYFEQGGEVKEILIQFEKAIPVRKIFVVENFGIGLKEVFLIDEQGGEREKFSLNQNFDFRLNIISKISHITLYKQTDYKVKFLRIVVHEPFSASEVCQVDATGISSEDVHYLFPPRHVIARRQLAAKFPFTLNYQLLDHENQQPLVGAEVVLTDLITQLKDTLVTDNEGRVVKPLTHSKFSLQVAREGYFVGNDYTFSTLTYEKGTIVTQNATVRRFQPGKSFVFYGLFSTPNAVALTEKDMQILEKILKTLQANPQSVVALRVHTDSRGNDDFNMEITQVRAEVIAEYLKERGVEGKRLLTEGLGETQLINECANGVLCDSKKHTANRRLVVEVVDYLY